MTKEDVSAVLTSVLTATKIACLIVVTTIASLLFLEVRKTVKQVNDGTYPTIQKANDLLDGINDGTNPTLQKASNLLDGINNGTNPTMRGLNYVVNTIAHPIDRVMGWNSFSKPENTVHNNSSTGAAYNKDNNNENKNDSGDGSKTTHTEKSSTIFGVSLGEFDIEFSDSDILLG